MAVADATPAPAGAAGVGPVVVTGLGAVSGFGWGVDALWAGLCAGATAIRPLGRFATAGHRTRLAAEVPLAAATGDLSMSDVFALAAAGEALAQAGADVLAGGAEAGVFFASSTGGMWESEGYLQGLLGLTPLPAVGCLASQEVNGPGDAVARRFRVTGPVQTISSACASGGLALGAALAAVRSGEVEVAIAGGADSLCQLTYAGFNSLRSIDEEPCRPFRAGRAGMSFGEGAAVLVLEPLARALARGARPLAALAGAGAACDAHHMTAPHPAGLGAALAIEAALADAALTAADIDFVNAHATGTPLNDAAEWQALERVFGGRAACLPVCATKAAVGHLLGSAGAIEALVTVLSLHHRLLHPVPAGAAPLDAACPVALVSGAALPLPAARAALSLSLAFGGSNAALVLTRSAGAAA